LLVLATILSDVLRCVLNNIVCPCWFCPWYCVTSCDVLCITLFVLVDFGHAIVTMLYKTPQRTSNNIMAKTSKEKQCYTKHIKERQTIPWPKPTRTNNVTHCLTFFDVFYITLFFLVGFGHDIV
jgi:hypothetical protein